MNKNVWLVLVGVVALGVVAFAPATNGLTAGLVGLPDEGRIVILSLLTAGVTWLLLQLSAALGIDLAGYVQPIVAIIAPIVITFFEKYLSMIPASFDGVVLTVIHLIVLLLGSLGGYMLFKRGSAPKSLLV